MTGMEKEFVENMVQMIEDAFRAGVTFQRKARDGGATDAQADAFLEEAMPRIARGLVDDAYEHAVAKQGQAG